MIFSASYSKSLDRTFCTPRPVWTIICGQPLPFKEGGSRSCRRKDWRVVNIVRFSIPKWHSIPSVTLHLWLCLLQSSQEIDRRARWRRKNSCCVQSIDERVEDVDKARFQRGVEGGG